MPSIQTSCCVVGGGPAGMMLGFLLARMGVDVVVLEKHGDFLRDFRGDTIHPSTLELMYELGLLDDFLKRPHNQVTELGAQIGEQFRKIADLTHLPTHCKFLVLMPQWEFLNFIAEQGKRYSTFRVEMTTAAIDLIEENGRVAGVRAQTSNGPLEIRSTLTVGADGRHSVVRERAGFDVEDMGAPMDVLWMRLSREPGDPDDAFGHIEPGKLLVMINRGDYWQCGYVIPKGAFDAMQQAGIEQFRASFAALEPRFANRVAELKDWNDVKLLTVKVDRLKVWSKPGLLCIGDAAHAMSPIGGVGINLAIQDAVAAANILGPKLASGKLTDRDLGKVQQRRWFPTRATQWMQVAAQNVLIKNILGAQEQVPVPWAVRLLQSWPWLRRIPARVVGMGFRPEHIRTPEAAPRDRAELAS